MEKKKTAIAQMVFVRDGILYNVGDPIELTEKEFSHLTTNPDVAQRIKLTWKNQDEK